MSDLFSFLNKLVSADSPSFIREQRYEGMSKVPIFGWIGSSITSKEVIMLLDEKLYDLDDEAWFLYAWSLLADMPAAARPKRWQYLKVKDEEMDEEVQYILNRVQEMMRVTDKEFNHIKQWHIEAINDDRLGYVQSLGFSKKDFKKVGLGYEEYDPKKEDVVGLGEFI